MDKIEKSQPQKIALPDRDLPSSYASGKPTLTNMQQVAHLKSKGVRFDACSEEAAAEYLSRCNNYLRATSYRALFPRQVEGPDIGNYIGLDFAHLVALSHIDRCLRSALREVSADVEHFSKIKLLRLCEEHGEDGYEIVSEFLANLNHAERRRLVGMLERCACEGEGHDMYTGDLIMHYGVGGLSVWVLVEVLEFGPFLTLYKFAGERWGLEEMVQERYVLKSVKALRNAASHNSCIANGLVASASMTASCRFSNSSGN